MTKHNLCQFIVKSFVKSPNWAKEIKIAQKLITEEFDEAFWISIPKEFEYTSLAYFLTDNGKKFLLREKEMKKLQLPEKEAIILEEKKFGEDKKFEPTVKTLREFLKK